MAVKIAQYDNRLTPSTNGIQAQASGVQVSDAIGAGLQNLGNAGMGAAITMQQVENWQIKKQDEIDTANQMTAAHSALIGLTEGINQHMTDASSSAEPGAFGFTKGVQDTLNEKAAPILEGDWKPKVKQWLQQNIDTLHGSVTNNAMQFEAKAGVDFRLGGVDKALDKWAQTAAQDDKAYPDLKASIDTMIDHSALGPELSRKVKDQAKDKLVMATWDGLMKRDPKAAAEFLKGAYQEDTGNGQLNVQDLQVDPAKQDTSKWDKRPDGSAKGNGFLGLLQRPDGKVSSEISVGVTINGQQMDIPTLVPTLTRAEVKTLLTVKSAKDIPDSIIAKAADFAKARIAAGKSVFAGPDESPAYKAPSAGAAGNPGSFDTVMSHVFKMEGGYNADDGNGYPVNFGINGKFHPNVDIKSLTKEQAAGIYKREYWDKIGGDKLAPGVAMMVMDAAVNQGVGYAQNLLKESGGDVAKMAEMRRADYEALAQNNPSKRKYLNNWLTRLDKTAAAAGSDATFSTPSETINIESVGVTAPGMQHVNQLLNDTPIEKIPSLISQATQEQTRQMAAYRVQFATQEADQLTMMANGIHPDKPLTLEGYTQAYGDEEGLARFQNYQKAQVLGDDIASVKTMPLAQQQALLESRKPDPNLPGYALSNERYATLAKAVDSVNTARNNDPVQYAIDNHIGGGSALNWNDTKTLAASLTQRVALASVMTKDYGVAPTLLTKAESTNLLAGFAKMTDSQKVGFLSTINQGVKDPAAYRAIMQQIAPDSPVTALVGRLVGLDKPATFTESHMFGADTVRASYDPKVVALTIMKGERILNPNKGDKAQDGNATPLVMPKEADFKTAFDEQVGASFANQEKQMNVAYQAVKDYYAAKSSDVSDFNQTAVDTKRMKEAIEAVTGGVTDVNGKGSVRRPWGMSESNFVDNAKLYFDTKMQQLKLPYNFSNYGLENFGDGYLVRAGTGYLLDTKGQPISLSFGDEVSNATPLPAAPLPNTTEKIAKPTTTRPRTK